MLGVRGLNGLNVCSPSPFLKEIMRLLRCKVLPRGRGGAPESGGDGALEERLWLREEVSLL